MNIDIIHERLKILLNIFKKRLLLPENIGLYQIGNFHFASIYEIPNSEFISDNVYCGIDFNSDLAVTKALIEFTERYAQSEGVKINHPTCVPNNSDGLVGYPLILNLSKYAQKKARENAFSEAVERYVWASWWDNSNFKHTILTLDDFDNELREQLIPFLKTIDNFTRIEKLYFVSPYFDIDHSHCVFLIFAKINSGGFISGGAAGPVNEKNNIIIRAFSELMRHSIALSRILISNFTSLSFYENRILFFGSGKGNLLVNNRLYSEGSEIICLPQLIIDEEVPHVLNQYVYIHRCYFINRPEFLGGPVERFCI